VTPALRECFRALVAGKAAWPLYLHGPAGTGKTSAALAMLDHCGHVLGRLWWPDSLRDWCAGFVDVRAVGGIRIKADNDRYGWSNAEVGGAVSWRQLTEKLDRLPLVVFDEIGVGKEASDFRLDVLLEVLDRRANDPVRPFVVTSNLSPSAVEKVYDDRVSSRILSGTVFHLAGGDRRLRKPGG
jgi:DNA replication protein DnaC